MLNCDEHVIAVDLGNTRIKCGLVHLPTGICTFDDHFPAKNLYFSLCEYLQKIAAASGAKNRIPVIIAGNTPETFNRLSKLATELGFSCRRFQYRPILPFLLDYENAPGADRLAHALYTTVLFPGHDHVIISAGTAVTVDLIVNNTFAGGTIIPGITSQLNCLPLAAPVLPKVSPDGTVPLPGKSTETCIRSGILNSIAGGIEKIITSYRRMAPNALIHACGGDWPYLSPLVNETVLFNNHMTLAGIALSERFI
jgi:type III pantothenate kinase